MNKGALKIYLDLETTNKIIYKHRTIGSKYTHYLLFLMICLYLLGCQLTHFHYILPVSFCTKYLHFNEVYIVTFGNYIECKQYIKYEYTNNQVKQQKYN